MATQAREKRDDKRDGDKPVRDASLGPVADLDETNVPREVLAAEEFNRDRVTTRDNATHPDPRPDADVWLIRGEGGDIIAMSPPLGEGIPARLRSGALMRVNSDGTPWVSDDEGEPFGWLREAEAERRDGLGPKIAPGRRLPKPLPQASKQVWVDYAASTGHITASAAEGLEREELIARFG